MMLNDFQITLTIHVFGVYKSLLVWYVLYKYPLRSYIFSLPYRETTIDPTHTNPYHLSY